MSAPRLKFGWLFAGLGLLMAMLLGGFVLALRLNANRAAEQLVKDAQALAAETYSRPSHASPPSAVPSGECAGPLLASFHDVLGKEPQSCKDFRAAKTAAGPIPEDCKALLAPDSLLQATKLMGCSRAERWALADNLLDPTRPGFKPWVDGARMLAWKIRAETAAGHADSSLELCADLAASARDVSYGGGLIGGAIADAILKATVHACGEAIDSASVEAKLRLATALVTIRGGLPRPSRLMRDEGVSMQLSGWGAHLTPAQRQAIPPQLRGQLRTAIEPGDLLSRLQEQQAWPQAAAHLRELVTLADLPLAERTAAFAESRLRHENFFNGLWDSPDYDRLLSRYDEVTVLLRLLEEAARLDCDPDFKPTFPALPVAGGVELTPVEKELAAFVIRLHRDMPPPP